MQIPLRYAAVWNSQPPGRQRLADQRPHPLLVSGFSGENHPNSDSFTGRDTADVVRRERTRRLMVPPAAQRLRDRAAKRIGIGSVAHRDHSVVGEGVASVIHQIRSNPTGCPSAAAVPCSAPEANVPPPAGMPTIPSPGPVAPPTGRRPRGTNDNAPLPKLGPLISGLLKAIPQRPAQLQAAVTPVPPVPGAAA